MNKKEQELLRMEAGDAEPRLCLRSDTRIDAGRWFRRSPLWLCVMADELVLLAVARRRFSARVPIADCPSTHYNHATGELVIEPAESLKFNRIAMTPGDALRVLNLMNIKA